MVHNISKVAKLPFSNAMVHPHSGRVHSKGSGMGSVLLRTGGPGAGSSYMDMDDYIATTGINPYARAKSSGKGLESLSSKLSKLNVSPPDVKLKKKNITMSF